MFVHGDWLHLVINLIIQLFLGIPLEVFHGWWRVTLVYLSGVLAGSVGASLFAPTVTFGGASGGVFALLTAHIASIILNWKEMKHPFINLFFFLAYFLTDLIHSIHRHQTVGNANDGYIIHLSGAFAGLLVGIGVLKNLEKLNFEKTLWVVAVSMYVALMISGISTHIYNPCDYFNQNTTKTS
jgi:rhomboid-related protein 1/2/3